MTYATQQLLTDRYGEAMLIAATDRGAIPSGLPDAGVIARALAAADAVIDGYLTGRYALPMAAVPPLLTDLAQAIAIWKLHPYDTAQKLKDDYDAALRMLRDIADGRIKLDVAGVEVAGTGGTGARITEREQPITAKTMTGYI